jgi:hypothetical protein
LVTGAALVILVGGVGGGSALLEGEKGVPERPDVVRAPAEAVPGNGVAVTGVLQRIGGPAGTPPRGIAGTVHFRASDGTITSAVAEENGRFSIAVPPGRYVVTGNPAAGKGQPPCQADAPVVVPAGGLSRVQVNCHIR